MTTTEPNSGPDLPEMKETGSIPEEGKPTQRWFAAINDYITLTKPPIILLLLVTAAGGMFLAQAQSATGGLPSLGLMALVWLGGAMASGGANALNHHYDRDIDGVMQRTRQRPVASNRISPAKALIFGITLNVIAFAILVVWVNWLAAALTLAATLFYVLVYTRWLKRTTPHNIVIGGAAGAIPPMVGWAAVTGTVELPAVYLFALVFFWTPPHFWALSLLIQKDYERANVPMLSVVASRDFTVSTIFLYSLVLVGVTLMFALTDAVSWIYAGSALVLGGIFIWMAWQLRRNESAANARKLYLFSLLYLGLLFVAVMVGAATGY